MARVLTEEPGNQSVSREILSLELAHQAVLSKDENSIHELDMLIQLRRQHDDGMTIASQLSEEDVKTPLGADVNSTSRVVENEHFRFRCKPAGDHDFLLISAAESCYLMFRAPVND